MAAPTVHLTPVFVEPTIAHSLLRAESYVAIAVLELLVAAALVYVFFGSDVLLLLRRPGAAESPLGRFAEASLRCTAAGGLVIDGVGPAPVPALALDGRPVVLRDCGGLLHRINGPRKVHLVDVLGRR
nr:MAG: putative membrane protein [Equine parapoxvirus]